MLQMHYLNIMIHFFPIALFCNVIFGDTYSENHSNSSLNYICLVKVTILFKKVVNLDINFSYLFYPVYGIIKC